jgi:hypothetical protein
MHIIFKTVTMDNNLSPIHREAIIKAIAAGNFESLQSIKNEIDMGKSGEKTIRVNGFLDLLMMHSIEAEAREKGERYIGDPKNKFVLSPELERLLYCVESGESLSNADKEQLRKYDQNHRRK